VLGLGLERLRMEVAALLAAIGVVVAGAELSPGE
jgi:hypothetical protein